ncbi:MAG: hypothetical protein F8N37_02430 [Telmatospirillum sp.]|nr:hypothetical protein [Telmatospirillum sp.]
MRHLFPAALSLFLLAGCAAGTGWVNPLLPKEQAATDLRDCRRSADDALGPSAYVPAGEDRTGNPMTLVDRTDNARRHEALVASCMASKGYRRVK